MNRATADKINNDPQIIALRMQAEELINNIDTLNQTTYDTQSKRIEREMTERFAQLYQQYV